MRRFLREYNILYLYFRKFGDIGNSHSLPRNSAFFYCIVCGYVSGHRDGPVTTRLMSAHPIDRDPAPA